MAADKCAVCGMDLTDYHAEWSIVFQPKEMLNNPTRQFKCCPGCTINIADYIQGFSNLQMLDQEKKIGG